MTIETYPRLEPYKVFCFQFLAPQKLLRTNLGNIPQTIILDFFKDFFLFEKNFLQSEARITSSI